MTHAKAERIDAWLQSLKGQIGTFRFTPRQTIKYALTGLSLAIRGYAYNDTVSVKGFAPGTATGLRLGQYFTIGEQLLQIVEAGAVADANGAVTVSFEPALRANYDAGALVNFATPTGLFKLASADGVAYTLTPDRAPDFGMIQAREVI